MSTHNNDGRLELEKAELNYVYKTLETSYDGLTSDEAAERIEKYGYNEPAKQKEMHLVWKFLAEFKSPLVILLFVIAGFSIFFGEKISAIIIFAMGILGTVLSFVQEHKAQKNVDQLIAMVRVSTWVYRDGAGAKLPIREIVPGDIVELAAGAMVPADIRIIECNHLYVNQSSLTGESFPVEKTAKPSLHPHLNADDANMLFMGSSVVSGMAKGVVLATGVNTQFGKMSTKLSAIQVETSFDKGVKDFTKLMIRLICFLGLFIFVAVLFVKRDSFSEALLFSLAVAVGLAPEMLPMLVTVNLSRGAIDMAKKDVIVKRLDSIQNVGAMNILCTDKTGTLTLDSVVLVKHCDAAGKEDEDVLRQAFMNSYYQTGLNNLLDKAILKHKHLLVKSKKIAEIPFDFQRRIVSVVVSNENGVRLIAKGAPEDIFHRCEKYALDGKTHTMNKKLIDEMNEEYARLSNQGFRVLAIAYKDLSDKKLYSTKDEVDLTFKGFMAFLDPPKPTAAKIIEELGHLGVELKILTGDNEIVTRKICSEVNLDVKNILTGPTMEKMTERDLRSVVKTTSVFARLNPIQKERVIKALQSNKNIVGFMGDGINDAPALKVSDVGISVDNAADVAKETADIILLKKELTVLRDCVKEGRKTFGNIVKYIKMGASSNFGNMFSMTGASLFLPILPMTPVQILLNNFLYDVSQVTIPTDNVDHDYVQQPRPWNIDFIRRFMLIIGPISSLFDFITFGVLWVVFRGQPELFHTGWFIESLMTQTFIIHIIRTNKVPFLESRPSKALLWSSIVIVIASVVLPYTALAKSLGFTPLPVYVYFIILLIVAFYLVMVEFIKRVFVKKYGYQ